MLKYQHELVILEAQKRDWRACAWWLASRFPEEYGGTRGVRLRRPRAAWVESALFLERQHGREYAPALEQLLTRADGSKLK